MKFTSSLKPKLIYIFRINDEVHKDCLKIGETTCDDEAVYGLTPNSKVLNVAAKKRINEYTQTAGIQYDLLHTEMTIYNNDGLCSFNDKDVHKVLTRSGIKRKIFDSEHKANEWFYTDLETAKKAIAAVKEGRNSLNASDISHGQDPIIFRPEQQDAINRTKKQFKKSNQMLWNAKMRFGKTLSSLQVVKEMEFHRTLILTHRPVVDKGWFEDFGKIFYDRNDYTYGSKNNGDTFDTLESKATNGEKYVYFASIQDLRGSETVGGNFDKDRKIFATPWDLIIVDEAHEGTQTELGKAVMKELTKDNTKIIHLSGTPFNLFDDFKEEEEIYTWDYVMEQRAKMEWDKIHFGDPNPYASLPCLNIYTYDLGRLLHEYIDEDAAFNFREFFRVNESVKFIHESDVQAFINLLSKNDKENCYPFSNDEYRNNFRHTLWMIPGVKEAKALSALLQKHEVFRYFKIVNVAGTGDEEEENKEALKAVNDAIGPNSDETYTITLSCGRLTTGVSIPAWTAVLMLAGSLNTSVSSYMQTVFRVQTPATINGRMKEECYVFDFAPDRTLKVIAETAKISSKAGKTSQKDRDIMGDFLNFCPIISVEGSEMKPYDVPKMLEQLKKVYIERVVNNGFEDGYLYNDELMKLNDIDLDNFQELKGIIGSTKSMPKSNDIDINNQGFTNEEYEQAEDAEKNKLSNKELTNEEKKLLEERANRQKQRQDAISILRGISIRMPLLIYGAERNNENEEITIDNFTSLIDSQSWEEFMPKGVSKQTFNTFKKYYDPEIFSAAGKRIRSIAKAADKMTVEERIERITTIFGTFRNPDKETVLTPWRVVNMHLGDCLGGYKFYDETNTAPIEQPQYIDKGEVTKDVFNPESRVLEINSKSGLYPLYVTYSIYRSRLAAEQKLYEGELSQEQKQALWDLTVRDNVFVICKTQMAKSITKRTLVGFRKAKVNTRHFEDLINQITNKSQQFIDKVKNGKTYCKTNNDENMKFNAIVGNPPYQVMDGGGKDTAATPIYNKFVSIAKTISPNHLSMIIPARWYSGGRGLDEFRSEMLADKQIRELYDFVDSRSCFPAVDIAGGVCYFLWDKSNNGTCLTTSIDKDNKRDTVNRNLNDYSIFIRQSQAVSIIEKVRLHSNEFLDSWIYNSNPFGFRSFFDGKDVPFDKSIPLFTSRGYTYVSRSDINQNSELIDKWKVIVSKTSAEHAGQSDNEGKKRILSRVMTLSPGKISSETYLLVKCFDKETEADNLVSYIKTKFFRFLLSAVLLTQNIAKDKFCFVPTQILTSPYTDDDLYKKYSLSADEIAFIESTIKPME